MYSVYADGVCIYNDVTPLDDYKIINPELELKDNLAGSLKFTLPAKNANYDSIKRLTSEIVVKRHNVEIWSGRVTEDEKDFFNNKKIYCEGELSYLNDSFQPPAEYHDMTVIGMLTAFINIHNTQVDSKRQFSIGVVTVTDTNDSLYRYSNYESTLECINDKLVKRLGGHLRIRKVNGVRYLDYLADYPNVSTQKINFGKNLMNFTENYNTADFVTSIVPRGAQINGANYSADSTYEIGDYAYYSGYVWRCTAVISAPEAWNTSHWTRVQRYFETLTPYLTVEEVYNGNTLVDNADAVEAYGRIVGVVDWDDVTDPTILLSKARQYLSEVQFDKMTLSVSAIDLHYMDFDIEAINILDEVRVVSRPHGLDRLFPVSSLKIPLDKPENTEFTMGADPKKTTLSGSIKDANNDIMNKINNLPQESKILEEAKNNATGLINMATNGYVTIIKNQNGTSELLISNEQDWTRATKLWRWNINGLGYSNDGGRTYGLAMTMDGSIVANYISSGTMYADRVRGGTFLVGGNGTGRDGSITVQDVNGNTVALMNKNGVNVYKGEVSGATVNVGGTGSAANGQIIIRDTANRTLMTITTYGLTLYDENGVAKAYMDHSGLTISQGTINGATINAGGTMNGAINIYDANGNRVGHWDGDGFDVSNRIIFNTPAFRVDSSGSIYGHGDLTMDGGLGISGYTNLNGVHVHEGLYVSGEKSRIVDTETYGKQLLQAYETPTPYFGDIGEGETDSDGECLITIDSVLLETIDTNCQYQVFLQAYGEGSVYISERTPFNFTVKGTPNLKFGWELKAIQKDYNGIRFKEVDMATLEETERTEE